MNEAETRAEHIDPALRAAGWGVVEGSRVRREVPITLGRLEGAGRRGKALTADYVLEYVSDGVHELAPDKLRPLLRLRYGDSMADAIADLGPPAEIGLTFTGFQRYLYAEAS